MARRVKRAARWLLVVVVGALGALVLAARFSGRQAPIDVVAVTQARDGVPLESAMVATNGVRLHVVSAGPRDGPPVVLLHGYPEFWWGWHEQIARLARAGFRVVAPDLRGYDASDKPPGIDAYRLELVLGDVVGLVDALGYRQVSLAGHDWGGAVAWHLVLEHPERFVRLVMFNAPHPLAWVDAARSPSKEHASGWYRLFFRLPVLPELATRAGNWRAMVDNLRGSSRPGTFSDADLDLYRFAWDRDDAMHAMINWYRALGRHPYPVRGDGLVRVPTRIVWGMQDRYFESRLAHLSLEHCALATLAELPDAGHWLLHEEPERTSEEMIAFFSN